MTKTKTTLDETMTERPTLDETMQRHGWTRCPVDSPDRLNFTPMGGVTYRKGYARVELTGACLVDRDYVVSYYIPDHTKVQITVSALVVDYGHRGHGVGHEALSQLLFIGDQLGWDEIYLEAVKIAPLRGIGKSTMDDLALRYWYKRHGFEPRPRYSRDGKVDGESTRVMMRKRRPVDPDLTN